MEIAWKTLGTTTGREGFARDGRCTPVWFVRLSPQQTTDPLTNPAQVWLRPAELCVAGPTDVGIGIAEECFVRSAIWA
jgi:hypothetical protein